MSTINQRIRELREAAGLPLEHVAAKLGVSYQAVQQWERPDGTQPRRMRMEALATVLNTTVEYLETGKATEYAQTVNVLPAREAGWWPFRRISAERIRRLGEADLAYLEGRIESMLETLESAQSKRRNNASA